MTGMIEFYCRPSDRRDKAVQELLRQNNVRVLLWNQLTVSEDVIMIDMTLGK
jgi:hypothetical protein